MLTLFRKKAIPLEVDLGDEVRTKRNALINFSSRQVTVLDEVKGEQSGKITQVDEKTYTLSSPRFLGLFGSYVENLDINNLRALAVQRPTDHDRFFRYREGYREVVTSSNGPGGHYSDRDMVKRILRSQLPINLP